MNLLKFYILLLHVALLLPIASFTQITEDHKVSETGSLFENGSGSFPGYAGYNAADLEQNGDPLIATRSDTWNDDSWMNTDSVEYYYDENNLLIERLTRSFENNAWVYKKRIVFEYDANFNEISELRQNIVPDGYVNELLFTSEYDANNNLTVDVMQFWYVSSWSNVGSKDIYEYDASNNETYHLLQNWVSGTSGYADVYALTKEYNANNDLTWQQKEEWVNISGVLQWIPNKQIFYEYDAYNNLSIKTEQSWNAFNSTWSTYDVRTYEYDLNNNVTYIFVENNMGNSQNFFEYDANNNVTNLIIQEIDDNSGDWINFTQGVWAYDANSNNIARLIQNWNPYNSSWYNVYNDSWDYDASNNVTMHLFQQWDFPGEYWINMTRMIYYYGLSSGFTARTSIQTAFTVFPNPNSGDFSIDLGTNILLPGMVMIYNAYGQLVYSAAVRSGEYKITVNQSGLAQGTYFAHLMLGGEPVVQSFIITY